jgi:hypothetical protein
LRECEWLPVLDPILKIPYLRVNVWISTGKGKYHLEKTVFISPKKIDNGFVTIDGNTYGPLDSDCLVSENHVVGLGPISLFTAGNRNVLNLELGNSVPMHFNNELHRDARAYEEAMDTNAQINMLRNKEADKWRKQYMYLAVLFVVGFIAFYVIMNLPAIVSAIKSLQSGTGSSSGGPVGPRILLWLWRYF